MIKRLSLAAVVALAGWPAGAAGFDYYVLALTWTPSWCATDAGPEDARRGGQCDPGRDLGFTLHGLWPQDASGGWPEYCETAARDPSRRETAAMADVMGSGSLAWYQWKKHGRCSGLEPEAYFAAARRVYEALALPAPADGRATAAAIEAAFLKANPALTPDGVIVTCGGGRLREIRVCLTPELAPRACARDVAEDACRTQAPLAVPAMR
ncbi:MAG TPA: ribonuclease T2 [Amaricoccus sp.]|nr:ribonuclease T2 [Amaricoccus sp.]